MTAEFPASAPFRCGRALLFASLERESQWTSWSLIVLGRGLPTGGSAAANACANVATQSIQLRDDKSGGQSTIEIQCPELGFQFEELDQGGIGPGSMHSASSMRVWEGSYYVGADVGVGLKSVQTIDASTGVTCLGIV